MCPGLAVFNTGDSLIAVDIAIDTDGSCHGLLLAHGHQCSASNDNDETLATSQSAVHAACLSTSDEEQPSTSKDAMTAAECQLCVALGYTKNQLNCDVESNNFTGDGSHESVCYSCDGGMIQSKSGDRSIECFDDSNEPASSASILVKHTASLSHNFPHSTTLLPSSSDNKEHSSKSELSQSTVVPSQVSASVSSVVLNTEVYPSSRCAHLSSSRLCNTVQMNDCPVTLENISQCLMYSLCHYSSSAAAPASVEGD